jgi:ribonuclease HIII
LESTQVFNTFPKIGCDEVGKGDFFGPLVACAAYLDTDDVLGEELGIRDSKSMSDSRVKKIAPGLKRRIPHSVVRISPAKYNELYQKFKNINAILGWAHATAIKNLLQEGHHPRLILIDRFGPEFRVSRHFSEKDIVDKLIFLPKAEADRAVAAASVIARHTFLEDMMRLSAQAGRELPLGAGDQVDAVARVLARELGPEGMLPYVKKHFKNFSRL